MLSRKLHSVPITLGNGCRACGEARNRSHAAIAILDLRRSRRRLQGHRVGADENSCNVSRSHRDKSQAARWKLKGQRCACSCSALQGENTLSSYCASSNSAIESNNYNSLQDVPRNSETLPRVSRMAGVSRPHVMATVLGQ